MLNEQQVLFPAVTAYVRSSGLVDKAKGNLAAKLPRILGQGTTRAVGMKDPPAEIERKIELAGLTFPPGFDPPEDVRAEISQAQKDIEVLRAELKREDGLRRFAASCLEQLPDPKGYKDRQFFAWRLLLRPSRGGMEWTWSVTPHYAIVDKIPPDSTYVARAFGVARRMIDELTLAPEAFEQRLHLAWTMARHFSRSDDVLVTDVMKMYQVAGQDDKFWQSPRRQWYRDLPDATFAVNLINWRNSRTSGSATFEFVGATLHQASGPDARVFYMPMNAEGTDVRPMIFLRRTA